ncbi:hypothetical protein K0M31_019030 [Melipona bicolor]|uniref:Uncharacterized protein n=1 Tax=Melipona bicolor TaxID=60889 RepID=A0AA40KDU5_9HYME|nr:hypothetical protein K0M31_019030 [Melipona bicolor]
MTGRTIGQAPRGAIAPWLPSREKSLARDHRECVARRFGLLARCISYATDVAPADNPALPGFSGLRDSGKLPLQSFRARHGHKDTQQQTGMPRGSCSSTSWDQGAFPTRAMRLRDCFAPPRALPAVRVPFISRVLFSYR